MQWLETISEYPKPFDMTFGRLPELFDVNVDTLFKVGNPKAGCLADNLEKTKDGRKYFIQVSFFFIYFFHNFILFISVLCFGFVKQNGRLDSSYKFLSASK